MSHSRRQGASVRWTLRRACVCACEESNANAWWTGRLFSAAPPSLIHLNMSLCCIGLPCSEERPSAPRSRIDVSLTRSLSPSCAPPPSLPPSLWPSHCCFTSSAGTECIYGGCARRWFADTLYRGAVQKPSSRCVVLWGGRTA